MTDLQQRRPVPMAGGRPAVYGTVLLATAVLDGAALIPGWWWATLLVAAVAAALVRGGAAFAAGIAGARPAGPSC